MTFRILPHELIVIAVLVAGGIGVSEAADNPKQLKTSCDKGNARACGSLGFAYAQGNGVSQDDHQSAMLFRKACEGGDAPGCHHLARMYVRGTGVLQDDVQAACAAGSAKIRTIPANIQLLGCGSRRLGSPRQPVRQAPATDGSNLCGLV